MTQKSERSGSAPDIGHHPDTRRPVNESNEVNRFNDLYDETYERLLAFVHRRVRNREDAQDIVAETFAITWRRIVDVEPGGEGVAWVFAVARRVISNHRRAHARKDRLRERIQSLWGDRASSGDSADVGDLREEVLRALDRLPAKQQELLRMAAWEDMSHTEIGQRLGCSQNAVSVRLHRARRALQKIFDRQLDASRTRRNPIGHCKEEER